MSVTDESAQTFVVSARTWLRAFRRTRPFWGGVWLLAGGAWILHYSYQPLQLAIAAGFAGMGGLLTGGGLVLCGFAAWFAPTQRFLVGLIAMMLALASLVASNLGGFFVGMLLGLAGSSMLLGWGTKSSRLPAERGTTP
jgi:hypothetical protein